MLKDRLTAVLALTVLGALELAFIWFAVTGDHRDHIYFSIVAIGFAVICYRMFKVE